MSIQTIVLAAGASTRMGSPKALLDLDGATFMSRIAVTARAAGTAGVMIVIGPPDGAAIKAKLPPGTVSVWNPDPSPGMLTSVQSAVSSLPSNTLAILLWPVDLPRVKQETVRRILDGAPGKIIVPRHAGKGGHPVRVPRTLFAAIAGLPAEAGLRGLLEEHRASVVYVDVEDAGVVEDIDTPAEHAQAKSERSEKPPKRGK
ncbi:MAG: nucleotidyltransferase family protein [Myxococcales bacterium]|nr:nucleotidyltransferase family protein [Myxococcales bacterium]